MDGWMGESRGASNLSHFLSLSGLGCFTEVCLGSRARKALNPLIYLAVVFDMDLMRPAASVLGARGFSVCARRDKRKGGPIASTAIVAFTFTIMRNGVLLWPLLSSASCAP